MEIISGRYKIGNRKLGTGGFAEVFLGVDLKTNKKVAIKKVSLLQKNMKKEQTLEKLNLETELMKKLNHANIVEYYDVVKTDNEWYIIMEYCNAGTLENVIKFNEAMNKKKIIDFDREATTYYYLTQLKDALNHLRESDHVHRDIKPMNILLTKDSLMDTLETSMEGFGPIFKSDEQLKESIEITNFNHSEKIVLKLADFGLAKSFTEQDELLMNTLCGSPLYMAPELLMGDKYTSKADLWSYGVIMYELLFGTHPTPAITLHQLVSKVKSESINFHTEKNFTPYCFDLLKRLLVKNYDKRIDWAQFFNHKWFIYWRKVYDGENPSIQLEHSRELVTSHDRIVRRTLSSPIKINKDINKLSSPDIYKNESFKNVSLNLLESDQIETDQIESLKESPTNISPLGSSNLSKMKIDSIYSRNYNPGTYSDYPSSFPPTDPRRKMTQPLSISVRRITSTDSHFFGSPKKELTGTNEINSGYSKSYGASPQSRIFKNFINKPDTDDEPKIIDDYQGPITHKKSEPIDIKKQIIQNNKKI